MANAMCTVHACEELARARGWCAKHYHKWYHNGDAEWAPVLNASKTCTADGCLQPVFCRDLCRPCYRTARWRSIRWGRMQACYGLNEERYLRLLQAQGGGCAICGLVPATSKLLAVDHDHACCPSKRMCCGRCVRGLLCFSCNSGLGLFRDDPDVLAKASMYLKGP
jgi:hypothetical protein